MWVQKCDICGEEKKTERFRYKVKVEKEIFCIDGYCWHKVDICDDCQTELVGLIRNSKWITAIRLRKEKNNETN